MNATTSYLIRTKDSFWISVLVGDYYGWSGRRGAKVFAGRQAAIEAANKVDALIASYYASKDEPVPKSAKLSVVPLMGGAAISRPV